MQRRYILSWRNHFSFLLSWPLACILYTESSWNQHLGDYFTVFDVLLIHGRSLTMENYFEH